MGLNMQEAEKEILLREGLADENTVLVVNFIFLITRLAARRLERRANEKGCLASMECRIEIDNENLAFSHSSYFYSYTKKKFWSRCMNYLWGGMILIGITMGWLPELEEVTEAASGFFEEAVSSARCHGRELLLCGWAIAQNSGLIAGIVRRMNPLRIFSEIPQGHPVRQQILIPTFWTWMATLCGACRRWKCWASWKKRERKREGKKSVPKRWKV